LAVSKNKLSEKGSPFVKSKNGLKPVKLKPVKFSTKRIKEILLQAKSRTLVLLDRNK